jgi:hypothetical protein
MKLSVENCCQLHDLAYASGSNRAQADRDLRDCMYRNGQTVLAWPAWVIVRLVGWLFWKAPKAPYVG